MELRLGIDVGSTTVKLVLLDGSGTIVYSRYERHMSNVFEKAGELIQDLMDEKGDISVRPVITGSGGLSLADLLGIRFEQEVITCSRAVEELIPETDVAIELGGEDAKITFYGSTVEQRMNGTCAGGYFVVFRVKFMHHRDDFLRPDLMLITIMNVRGFR